MCRRCRISFHADALLDAVDDFLRGQGGGAVCGFLRQREWRRGGERDEFTS
jgi:hypothetical protein